MHRCSLFAQSRSLVSIILYCKWSKNMEQNDEIEVIMTRVSLLSKAEPWQWTYRQEFSRVNFVGQRFTPCTTAVVVVKVSLPGIFAVAVTFQHRRHLNPSHSLRLLDGLKSTGEKLQYRSILLHTCSRLEPLTWHCCGAGKYLMVRSMLLLVY